MMLRVKQSEPRELQAPVPYARSDAGCPFTFERSQKTVMIVSFEQWRWQSPQSSRWQV
jgi:hypothetical protein